MLSVKTDVNVPKESNKQKTYFLLTVWKRLTKRAGSVSVIQCVRIQGSVSVSKCHGSEPPWFLILNPVFRIYDILVWIRIRGSMLLTNGSGFGCGSGSCYLLYWPSRGQQKTNFLIKFFCLLLFEDTFTSFIKNKKSKRSHTTVGSRFFLLFLLDDRRIRIRIHTSD